MLRTDGTAGALVTLEGIDGCGKSTQAALIAADFAEAGAEVVSLREPGGTEISEKIRRLLLDPDNAGMVAECELMLYEASRAQLVREAILPALDAGAVVVCDRFYDSTYAYQAHARGLDEGLVREANALGSCGVVPARTLVFDIDPEIALRRATAGDEGPDRLEAEGLAFQARVREGFRALAAAEPERVRLVDAAGTPEEVHLRAAAELADLLDAARRARGGADG